MKPHLLPEPVRQVGDGVKYWFYAFSKFTIWLVVKCWCGLEVSGQHQVPRRGGCLLAVNHVSFLDPPVIGAACPRRVVFMARRDLFRQPLLAAFMRGVHVIPLARGEGDPSAIRTAVERLRAGDVVAIFPEGTRQLSGALGVAKRGVGLLAAAAMVPVIPVYLQGTFEALPPEARGLRRANIRVAFGSAIPYTRTPQSPREGHEQFARAVTAAWRALEAQAQKGHRTNP